MRRGEDNYGDETPIFPEEMIEVREGEDAEFELAKAGEVTLELDGAKSAKVWVDGKLVENRRNIVTSLSAGKHSIVLRFDPKALPKTVKVSASTGTFLVD